MNHHITSMCTAFIVVFGVALWSGMNCCTGDGNEPMPVDDSTLFVVNGTQGITSHAEASKLNGDVAPTTELPAGAGTSIFDPRSAVVTNARVLIVSRLNGGITLHDDALHVTGNTQADRIVDGPNSLLTAPNALALDRAADRLFVGNAGAPNGILVFDHVSDAGFTGDIPPDRTFGPPDREPASDDGKTMFINAMALDANGTLYVGDASGSPSIPPTRILVFPNAGAASGTTAPARTLAYFWQGVEALAIDSADRLLVVDSLRVRIYDNASTLVGSVAPDRTLTVSDSGVRLSGLAIGSDGTGFLCDHDNNAVYLYKDIATVNGAIAPDATLAGNNTHLSAPRHMFLFEP